MTSQAFVWILIGIATVVVVVAELALPRAKRRPRHIAVPSQPIDVAALTANENPTPVELPDAYVETDVAEPVTPAIRAPLPIMVVESGPIEQTPEAGSTGWTLTYNSAIGDLNVAARATLVNVLESISTAHAVDAIANAAANDPERSIRSTALMALARLVELDGEIWAKPATSAANSVISQRPKAGDDVARARSLLATVDVVIYED